MKVNDGTSHCDIWLLRRGISEHRKTKIKIRKAVIAQTHNAVQSQLLRVSCIGYLLFSSEVLFSSPMFTVTK
jgi:hypothetical protein